MIRTILCTAALAALVATGALADDCATAGAKSVKLVYDQPLPNVPGKSMRGVLVEYEPGGSSPAHTHPKSAFIYATVLEGAIHSKVNDGPVTTYRAGESCPSSRAIVTASARMPARPNPPGCWPCSSSIPTKRN